MQTDYLIVGQGLAGSLLALNLIERGKTVRVVDDGHVHAASKVAAGLINPITGRRHVLTWRFLDCWEYLVKDYGKWEALLGDTFFHQKPLLRFLKSKDEKALFEKKWKAGEFSGVALDYVTGPENIPGCQIAESCYRLFQAGFVQQKRLIKRVSDWLKEEDLLVSATWTASDFSRTPGLVKWREYFASRIIFTQGFKSSENPFFRDLPFRCAKGELLELEGPDYGDFPVLNRGKWLLPLAAGRYRAGATYDLQNLDLKISKEGAKEILQGLAQMVDWEMKIVEHKAGVRPALRDFRPVCGCHPWYPELVVLNGLGSKGSLLAPLMARELVEHLENDASLHPEADVERFRKFL